FRGTVMHSGAYTEGSAWKGRPALVLGSGNSGHDVAHDLHASGASVSIVQRGTTHIVSLAEAQRVYSIYAEGIPTEDCDLLATATPFPVLKRAYQHATAMSKRVDAPLHAALAARGFRLDDGPEGCGFQISKPAISPWCNMPILPASRPRARGCATAGWCRPSFWCWPPAISTSRRRCAPA
ncbi:MAG: hypothetical protein EBX37_18210, partial [Alphaproteobacteria bacterium]|nr:hypothetical protein [Alphaproteobacteria bacterium]